MKIHNMEQQSEEWFEKRKLKMSASHATAIGNHGAGLVTYIQELIIEHETGRKINNFISSDMRRGIETEDEARTVYEFETGNPVKEIGMIEYNKYCSCSPDGLIEKNGKKGVLEIKCYNNKNYYQLKRDYILTGKFKIESKYLWQIQMQMLIAEAEFCHFVIYNSNFNTNILIQEIYPNKEKFDALKVGFEKGEEMIKEELELLEKEKI